MSAAQASGYASSNHHSQENLKAEREKILRTASRKAQEKTLTLEETTDLFTQFNDTYSKRLQAKKEEFEASKENIDESWALKLLKDCEEETIPLGTTQQTKQKHLNKTASFQRNHTFKSNYTFKSGYNLARSTSPIASIDTQAISNEEQIITVANKAQIPEADLLDSLNRYQPLEEYNVAFQQKNTNVKIIFGLTTACALAFILTASWLL